MNTLASVRKQLALRRTQMSTTDVAAANLSLDDDGQLVTDGGRFRMSGVARAEVAHRARVPSDFFRKCPPALQATIFNTLYPRALGRPDQEKRARLVLRNQELVVGLTDPDLALLSGAEVLEIALCARPEKLDETSLEVTDFHLDGNLRVSIVSPQIEGEPRVGDLVRAGIDVLHSDTGEFGTQVSSYMLQLACTNGMLAKVCRHDSGGRARVRRAAAENEQLTRLRVRQIAEKAWGELDAKLKALHVLAAERVDNIERAIRAIGEKLRLTERMVTRLLEAVQAHELGLSGTLWDIVSAFTRLGTHGGGLAFQTRRYLQGISGDLAAERLERCPTCGALCGRSLRLLPRR